MNFYRNNKVEMWLILFRSLAVLLFSSFLLFSGCQSKPATNNRQPVAAVYYTCPMHHQIHKYAPGKCPICGMALVEVDDTSAKNNTDTLAQITLSSHQQFLADVHTDTARISPLTNELVLTGITMFDPKQQTVVSAWVNGYIKKMYVRNPGEKINVGEKLYDLYSPELLSAEKDYLLALQQKSLFKEVSVDFTASLQAMEQKLLRWGISEKQIEYLSREQPTGKVTIYSKTSGYLIQKMKEEGEYVKEGNTVLRLVKNNTLWVQAQLYDEEWPVLSKNVQIWVNIAGFNQSVPGKIVFDNPVNERNSRIHLINIAIANPDGKIQSGMLAYVHLETSKEIHAIVIPKSAVIYEEKNNYVWVKQSNGIFERRDVLLGRRNNTMTEIVSGVKPGEAVVCSGAYLINSEYILKHGSGANLSGMQMSDMKMQGRSK